MLNGDQIKTTIYTQFDVVQVPTNFLAIQFRQNYSKLFTFFHLVYSESPILYIQFQTLIFVF